MTKTERIVLGALGGLAAVCVKFLGQDYGAIISGLSNLSADQILEYKIAYLILTPILMFLGGLIAFCSEENKRLKVLALAISAPALITTWAGGDKGDLYAGISAHLMPAAYAQERDEQSSEKQRLQLKTPEQLSEKTAFDRIKGGVGLFFGYGKEEKKYWVVVGSFKDRSAAQGYADEINKKNPSLGAWTGAKSPPPNEYYPVIVGGYLPLGEASLLKERVIAEHIAEDAYLSPGLP
ncbi:MAG: SPOR domain-containing protein [Syntrophales bacterium]|nr:SPOR domain-containing protein [Syntrophales bacterium]